MMQAQIRIVITALALAAGAAGAGPSGPVFTYQGRLTESGAPASGLYDMVWRLFDAPTNGTPLGPTVTNENVAVTDGLFSVELGLNELSPQPDPPGQPGPNEVDDEVVWNRIDDDPAWLEVGVRRAGSHDSFRTLSPRQHMTSAPHAAYATHSRTAASLAGPVASNLLAGTYSSPVAFNNVANQFAGSGAGLRDLNAASLAQGTIPDARLGDNIVRQGQEVVLSNVTATGHVTATGDLRAERLVVGSGNVLSSPNGVIAGGVSNVVTVPFGAILSGEGNFVGSDYSVICGGRDNVDSGHLNFFGVVDAGTILGGWGGGMACGHNHLIDNATNCFIGGGSSNMIGVETLCAFIGGGRKNTNGTHAHYGVIAGGALNLLQSNAQYSVIGGGSCNVVQTNAAHVVIAGGTRNWVGTNAHYSTIGGGGWNEVHRKANYAVIAGGGANCVHTDADCSAIGGGEGNAVFSNAWYATIPGGRFAAATNYGQQAYASGCISVPGDAQASLYVVRGYVTNSTATTNELFLDGLGQKMKLRPNSAWSFDALVTGRSSAGGVAGFRLSGVIEHQPGAAPTTKFVGTVEGWAAAKTEGNMVGASAWAEPDSVNNALAIKTVTPLGVNAKWVATVRTSEVMY